MRPASPEKRIVAIVIGLTALALSSSAPAQDPLEMLVSLVQIIANPAAFDQKRIMVIGYVVLEFEHKAIYLNEADAKHVITRNGLWLDVSDAIYSKRARFHQRYVRVQGTFDAQRRGHLSLFSGKIENVTRFELAD